MGKIWQILKQMQWHSEKQSKEVVQKKVSSAKSLDPEAITDYKKSSDFTKLNMMKISKKDAKEKSQEIMKNYWYPYSNAQGMIPKMSMRTPVKKTLTPYMKPEKVNGELTKKLSTEFSP